MSKQRLWLFNYNFEFDLSGRPFLDEAAKGPWQLLNDSALWLAPLLREGDAIYMVREPDPTCFRAISDLLGFQPNLIIKAPKRLTNSTLENARLSLGGQYKDYQICLWGDFSTIEVAKKINSKATSCGLRESSLPESWQIPFALFPTQNFTKKAFRLNTQEFYQTHGDFYAKDVFGMSGQNLILNPDDQDSSRIKNWANYSDFIILEKKIEHQKEVSLHFDFTLQGWQYAGKTQLLSTEKGAYLGNLMEPSQEFERLRELEPLLASLTQMGYTGPLGMDLLVDQSGNHKLLEINGRFTMGRLALEWQNIAAPQGHCFLARLGLIDPLNLEQIVFPEGIKPLSYSYHGRGWLNILIWGESREEIFRILTRFQRKNKLSNIAVKL